MMQNDLWYKQEFIQHYFERLLKAFTDDERNVPKILETIELGHNYGIIFLTENALNEQDRKYFIKYLISRLKDYGYQMTSSTETEFILQASVRKRVSGIQLFGTVKIVEMNNEVRVLVTPYNDRQYESPLNRFKLMEVLLA